MRQAIVTKYISPTNYRGARIKATAAAGSVTMEYRHEHNPEANHRLAAMRLVDKFKWREHYDRLCGGQMADGRYCFVMVSEGFDACWGVDHL